MTDLIIPSSYARGDHPLAEYLRERGEKKFRNQAALADVLTVAVKHMARKRKMLIMEVFDAVLTSLVSSVQSSVPETQWQEVAIVLAEELRGRLSVRQVN